MEELVRKFEDGLVIDRYLQPVEDIRSGREAQLIRDLLRRIERRKGNNDNNSDNDNNGNRDCNLCYVVDGYLIGDKMSDDYRETVTVIIKDGRAMMVNVIDRSRGRIEYHFFDESETSIIEEGHQPSSFRVVLRRKEGKNNSFNYRIVFRPTSLSIGEQATSSLDFFFRSTGKVDQSPSIQSILIQSLIGERVIEREILEVYNGKYTLVFESSLLVGIYDLTGCSYITSSKEIGISTIIVSKLEVENIRFRNYLFLFTVERNDSMMETTSEAEPEGEAGTRSSSHVLHSYIREENGNFFQSFIYTLFSEGN